ncbi:hypothetical protein RUND412_002256 [Rhizina undulata]
MSLPTLYVNEVDALNREVLKSKPTDILQFCANFFNRRLESQRAEFLLSASSSSAQMPSSSPFAAPGFGSGENTFPGSLSAGLGFGMVSLDGGRDTHFAGIMEEEEDSIQSPTSVDFRTNVLGNPSSSRQGHGLSASPRSESPFSRGRHPFNTEGPPTSGSPLLSPASAFRSSSPGTADFPSNYNMGRRTSVSAESLAPSSSTDEWTPPVYAKTREQLSRLRASISGNFLFTHLEEEQTSQILSALMEKPIPGKDTRVITQGDVGDFFYVVEKGFFDVFVNPAGSMLPGPNGLGKKVNTIGPGGSFGELALMYNAPRAATIISTSSHSILWALDRVTFRRILMENTFKRRRMYEAFLEEVPILSSLVPYERAKIADALETITYQPGTIIIRQGDQGDRFFIIESGIAEVYKNGIAELVRTLSKGDYFGELALLNDAPRAATVMAKTKMKVASLGKEGFQRLLGPVTEIMRRNDPRLAEEVDPLASVSNPNLDTEFGGSVTDVLEEIVGRKTAVAV